MAKEENMLILKMLQDGSITAEQAAELLNALEVQGAKETPPDAPEAPAPPPTIPPLSPVAPVPPVPPTPPVAATPTEEPKPSASDGDMFDKAKERIATARERIAGMQEKLSAAEEKITKAEDSPNPWEGLADALKDIPGARGLADALRDPSRLAANARRQARRVARRVRSSLGDFHFEFNIGVESAQGEPTLSAPREATATIPAGGTLRVRNPLGDIEASGADVPDARIAGVLKVWSADLESAQAIADQVTLTVEQTPEGPTVVVNHDGKISRRVALDLKVFVPKNDVKISLLSPAGDVSVRNHKGSVVLATQSGDAKAAEIAGDVAAETASGDVMVEGATGNIQATSASGDINVIRVTGQSFKGVTQSGDISLREATIPVALLETVSGDATVESVSGRTLRIRSVSGDVQVKHTAIDEACSLDTVSGCLSLEARGPLNSGTISLSAVSGDVDLLLPRDTNAQIDITTKGGDVSGKFLGAEGNEKTLTGSGMVTLSDTVGKGSGTKIALTTVSGDINISQDSPVVEMS